MRSLSTLRMNNKRPKVDSESPDKVRVELGLN